MMVEKSIDYVLSVNYIDQLQAACLLGVGKTVGLWVLRTSDVRVTKAQVVGGHSILDGTRSHLQTTIQSGGEICRPCSCM